MKKTSAIKRITEIKNLHSDIIIFGAGRYGNAAYLYCRKKAVGRTIHYCDNDVMKQTEKFNGCEVYLPQRAVALYPDAIYIVANLQHEEEMEEQLVSLGVEKGNIYRFHEEDYIRQLTLDEIWEYNKPIYEHISGQKLNKDSLKTYTGKMQYSKIYLANEMKARLTDKYRVRQWVENKVGKEHLVPLLGVYKRFDEIDFSELPEAFVLKANHGYDMNYIVSDKRRMNLEQMKEDFDKWLCQGWGYVWMQLHYQNIPPCIIAEEYIEAFSRESFDYKFFCFDGKVKMIMIVKNIHRQGAERCFYDENFNFISCDLNDGVHMPAKPYEAPKCLGEMIRIAEKLSEGIDQVRVDLYAPDNHIYFGEMTFTSWGGMVNMQPEKVDKWLGSNWKFGGLKW